MHPAALDVLRFIQSKNYSSGVLVMVGVQGCGKSSLATELIQHLDGTITSSDRIRALLSPRRDELDPTVQHSAVWKILYHECQVVAHLQLSRWLIVDATNVYVGHRRELVAHVHRYWPTVIGVRLDVPLFELLKRNASRPIPRTPDTIERYHEVFCRQDSRMKWDKFDAVLHIKVSQQ